MRYKPWGEVRAGSAPTRYTYTGQYSNVSDFGLLFYNARWYDPGLSRFTQADPVVPDGVQGYDRYAYVGNSPVNYTDPSGNRMACGVMGAECEEDEIWKIADGEKEPSLTIQEPVIRSRRPKSESGEQLREIGKFAKYGNEFLKAVIWIGNHGEPLYKQWKGAGTAGPAIEGTIGGALQVAQDLDNPNLSMLQRGLRALVVGGEAAVSEWVSEPVAAASEAFGASLGGDAGAMVGGPGGAAAGAVVGGFAGYEAGGLGATRLMDTVIWDWLNIEIGLFP